MQGRPHLRLLYCLVTKLAGWKTREAEYLLSLLHCNQTKGEILIFSDEHSKVFGYCKYRLYFSPSILARKCVLDI